jgi:hypothetical protein
MKLLFWLPLLAATAHITEEFVWPGGFAEWYRWYRPEIARSVTNRFLVIINGALLLLCVSVGIDRPTRFGPALLLTTTALLLGNGLFHLSATVHKRRYSPGLVTGVLLYVPLGIASYVVILRERLASVETAIVAAVLGGSYHVFSVANHRRRDRAIRDSRVG